MTRLILVRHAETAANREFRYIGRRDDPLSEKGQEQARQLAQALAMLPVVAIYSSPAQRAYQTASSIAACHKQEVQVENDLRECDFGLWEGLSRADIHAQGSSAAEHLARCERDPTIAPPDGESVAAMSERVCTLVPTLIQVHHEQTILLVSHVGPVKALLCMALRAPLTSMFHFFVDPATISIVDWQDAHPMVRLLNSYAHQGWDQARWLTDARRW
jgi:ribonuclease H / adenosylcobalamin/alpha-ribazole phosphatase